jgi:hypothetical protein
VPFRYCRSEAEGKLCASTLNCWWETFDVEGFLREHAPEALSELLARRSAPKITTIVDLIEQAKRRASQAPETPSGDQ